MRRKRVHQIINIVDWKIFIILFGSIFINSSKYEELSNQIRIHWTIIGLMIYAGFWGIKNLNSNNVVHLSINRILNSIYFIGWLEVLYVILQIFEILPKHSHFFVFTGNFDNPAIVAMLLSFCIPIGLYRIMHAKSTMYKSIWINTTIIIFIVIIISGSRTGIISSIISTLYLKKQIRPNKLLRRRFTLWIITILAFIILLILYTIKKDSAIGRLYIWRISLQMITDKPLLGFGLDGFASHFMWYQSKFLSAHPNSPFLLLADNITNPFNEFLYIGISYGTIGLICTIIFFTLMWQQISLIKCKQKKILSALYLILMCWCMFSYPLHVPFVWIIILLITITILSRLHHKSLIVISHTVIITSIIVILSSIYSVRFRAEWGVVQAHSLFGHEDTAILDFKRLYKHLSKDGRFLYNYGAELHIAERYEESINILNECASLLNDYNLHMIMGDDYMQICKSDSAILHYSIASNMVPNRLLPLYQIMNIYSNQGDSINAKKIALIILNKRVKIRSNVTDFIIRKAIEVQSDDTTIREEQYI